MRKADLQAGQETEQAPQQGSKAEQGTTTPKTRKSKHTEARDTSKPHPDETSAARYRKLPKTPKQARKADQQGTQG